MVAVPRHQCKFLAMGKVELRLALQKLSYGTRAFSLSSGLLSWVLVGNEDVTFASYGLDGLRLGGIILDLAPNPGDADIDAAVKGLPIAAVSHVQELIASEYPVGVGREGLEEIELHAGDGNLRAI